MAGPYNPPVKNQAWQHRISLQDTTAIGSLKANPTIAAGDFKVDIDGAGFNNLGTLPSVSPAGGVAVLLSLANTEMNGDVITIVGIDQTSPKEWADFFLCINTTASGVTVTTNNDKTGYALTSAYDFSKGTVAMTESYAALHAAPTAIQALFGILQVLNERNLSGTTLTIKKVDGSTTAETFTLDSATTPTTQTRAT